MFTSTRMHDYLDANGIVYDTLSHPYSGSSLETAISAHISPSHIAKGVLLEDHEGHHLMAVLPASHKLAIHELSHQLDSELHMLDEQQLETLFSDCDTGAVPALGQAYHINAIYDQALEQQDELYIESGDHKTLIHLQAGEFAKLTANFKKGSFSHRYYN